MPDDDTPIQAHRSGEHPVSYNELMTEIRALRKENKDQAAEISRKVEGVKDDLKSGALQFERHHARLNAVEMWQNGHDEHHRELKLEQREREAAAKTAEAEARKAGPHWAVQAAITTVITVVTTSLTAAVIYLLATAPHAVTP